MAHFKTHLLSSVAHNRLTAPNKLHTVTEVRHAASHIEDPCLSIGSHSAAAFTVVFDHTSYNKYWVTMVTGQKERLLEHAYVLTLNAGKNKVEKGITVFTHIQDT
jgi:hypothetical protein